MKYIVCIVLITVMLVPTVCIAEDTLYVNVKYGSYLNAHNTPRTNSMLTGRLDRGKKVAVTDTCDGFSRVLFVSGNSSGWVSSDFLSSEKPYEIPVGKYITMDKVILRKNHSVKSKAVMKLKKGKIVTVKDFFEDESGVMWAEVNGGYIHMDFLKYNVDNAKE